MAGIGFRLQKYFSNERDSYDLIKGVCYSTLISSGPWIITITSIAIISFFSQKVLNYKDNFIIKSAISYSYLFCLIIFGTVEMPITRYLSDKIYSKDRSSLKSTYFKTLLIFFIISDLLAILLYSFTDYSIFFCLICLFLLNSTFTIWLSMIFLSASKKHELIVLNFLIGGIISIISSVLLGNIYHKEGFLLGFTIGQAVTAVGHAIVIRFDNNEVEYPNFEYIDYIKRMPLLVGIGFFYYAGIWVDKLVFWFNGHGKHIDEIFYTNLYYDTAMFTAYLTVIPSMAIFLVKVETEFYISYARYYRAIEDKMNLTFLETVFNDIIQTLKDKFLTLIKIQGFITFVFWFFADEITVFLKYPPLMIPVF